MPIVVAINKIDLPNANPDRIKQQLSDHGLVPEQWGGETIFVEVSAKRKQNIDELLEMLLACRPKFSSCAPTIATGPRGGHRGGAG